MRPDIIAYHRDSIFGTSDSALGTTGKIKERKRVGGGGGGESKMSSFGTTKAKIAE